VQAHFVCLHRRHDPDFGKSIMPKQKSVQQQSGDWAMTGKVPVARVEGQELLPATIGRMKPSGTSRPWQDRRTLIS
jgi:hypothetical protein